MKRRFERRKTKIEELTMEPGSVPQTFVVCLHCVVLYSMRFLIVVTNTVYCVNLKG